MITCINKALCFVTLDCVALLSGVVSYCNEDTIRSLRVRSMIFLLSDALGFVRRKKSIPPNCGKGFSHKPHKKYFGFSRHRP